eukprot:6544102-Alexandrium_andersonii.AAC.1
MTSPICNTVYIYWLRASASYCAHPERCADQNGPAVVALPSCKPMAHMCLTTSRVASMRDPVRSFLS